MVADAVAKGIFPFPLEGKLSFPYQLTTRAVCVCGGVMGRKAREPTPKGPVQWQGWEEVAEASSQLLSAQVPDLGASDLGGSAGSQGRGGASS